MPLMEEGGGKMEQTTKVLHKNGGVHFVPSEIRSGELPLPLCKAPGLAHKSLQAENIGA